VSPPPWQVSEADHARPRRPGIAGFMRLRNEAEYLDAAFATHVEGLDELIVVHNRCTDETPAICERWRQRHPERISVFEYAPEVVPLSAPEAKRIDPRDEHSLANYYNWALTRTTREIVIKIDGDHVGDAGRFAATCARVRRRLDRDEVWPIYGLNITRGKQGVGIYNLYGFHPGFGVPEQRRGPPAFTAGDHCFYYVDARTRHVTHPIEGYEHMELGHKRRARVGFTYLFFHMKGMKRDRGTGNWKADGADSRAAWVDRVQHLAAGDVVSFGEMRLHNPQYFREADARAEFGRLFPNETLMPDPTLPLTPARVIEAAKGFACRAGLLRALGREK
jgi:hypothetical protein